MSFYLIDRREQPQVDAGCLRQMLASVLARLQVEDEDLEIELVDDAAIAALNEKYFDRPRPTNVLSFPLDREAGHLGNIVIGVDVVIRETEGLGYSPTEAVLYYLLHGLLHLLGYEHVGVEEEAARRMENLQNELFEVAIAG